MDHLQEAKDVMQVVEPGDVLELQMTLAQRALAHAVIALVERLDDMTYHGFDGVNRVQVFNKQDGP